jgi:DNA-binding response OmpR family regulator
MMQSSTNLTSQAEGWVEKALDEEALLGELARVLCGTGDAGEHARILVVEDDVDMARVIAAVFARDTILTHVAHSLQAAMDACFSFQPHLIVLDIGLPDGDGFNLVDWLRQHANYARLPLVVYSGREFSPAERTNLTLGPTHFLTKARVQPQQLEALVLTLLRSSRQMEVALPPESSVPNPERV